MAYRKVTKYKGVYRREIKSSRRNGKIDVCFDISYRHNGKLVWEKIGTVGEGYSPKLASNIRSERSRSIRHGEDLPKQKKAAPYFKSVVEKYLAWAVMNKTRAGRDDKSLYRNHLSIFDDKRLDEISPFDLERLKITLSKKDLSPATIRHCLVLIRQIINKAVLWGLYRGSNPVKGVKMPTLQNQRLRFLTYNEADILLKKLSETSEQLHAMTLISLRCGLRAGEIFSLKGQHLDFENGLVTISDPKNNVSRKAFMTSQVRKVLLQHLPDTPEDYVFRNGNGEKITEISKSFARVIAGLGFNEGVEDRRQKVTFHTLRHTFASWLALQGEQIQTIQELLGHKTLVMTMRYSHLMPDMKRKATIRLEKTFNERRRVERSKIIKIQE